MTSKLYKNKIKCAVFDLDGTLLNTIKTINYYLNTALRSFGLGEINEEDCMSFVGDGAVMLVRRALNKLDEGNEETFDRVYKEYNRLYDADPYYLTEPYEGVTELLRELRDSGFAIGVLSNKPDFATRAAVEHFFGDIFSFVAGGRAGIPLKPAPDALLSLLNDAGFSADETVYIGDSDQDILTGRNAGVTGTISVCWGFRSADHLASSGAECLVYSADEIKDMIT